MRLSWIFQAKRLDTPPLGFLYRGKNRKLHKITMTHLNNLKKDLEREEENMLWLRHPYLTIQQDTGHTRHMRDERFQEFLARMRTGQFQKFVGRSVRISDRLKSLMTADKWD